MKNLIITIVLAISIQISAQIPANYYNSANGLSGYALKTELRNIISNGHTNQGYNNLYNGYVTTDTDNYYDNDGTVLDMYSENPNGADSYNYTHNNNKCGGGGYTNEGDCYNREHLFAQSWFGSANSTLKSKIKSDIHHVVPSDGKVNGYRSSYPLANVGTLSSPPSSGTITNPTLNGSKLGTCSDSGFSGIVFEPIDEFKGDIARMYFYFATRYENNIGSWQNNGHATEILDGSSNKVFQNWYVDMLIQWHNQDPVSQREIDRNNAAYNYQGNGNPFINHPEWVNLIWNPVPDNQNPTDPTNLVASNPTANSIQLDWTASTDNIAVASYDIYKDNVLTYNTPNTTYIANSLNAQTNYCFTIKAKDASGNTSNFSNQSCEATLQAGSSGSTCNTETFELIPANSGSYANRTWNGDDGLAWSATNARTDQTINNKAITIKNGVLTAPTTAGGIGSLTVTTQRKFSGGAGTYDLIVNGNIVGAIPYDTNEQTTTINNINIENNVDISFVLTTGGTSSHRVAFDDLSWTCYSTAGINDEILNTITIYPNPAHNLLNIKSETVIKKVIVYNLLGEIILIKNNPTTIDISNLASEFYILKIIDQYNHTATKNFIKK